jgi:hypothetical protein
MAVKRKCVSLSILGPQNQMVSLNGGIRNTLKGKYSLQPKELQMIKLDSDREPIPEKTDRGNI